MISLSNRLKEFHPSLKLKSRPSLLLLCYYTISPYYVSSFQDQEISLHSLHCPLVTRWKITATFRKNHSAQEQPTWLARSYLARLYIVRTKSKICITSIPAMLNPLPLLGMLSVSSTPFPSRAPERTCCTNNANVQRNGNAFVLTFDAPPMK